MFKAQRLGHVVLRVSDPARSVDFYTSYLGLHVMQEDAEAGAVFMGLRDDGHVLDLVKSSDPGAGGACSRMGPPAGIGMHHVGFVVSSQEELKAAYFRMKDEGVSVIDLIDHGSTQSLYFNDPDGNIVELYWDRPAGWEKRLAGEIVDVDEALTFER